MMYNRMIVKQFNNVCPHCGKKLSYGVTLSHIPDNCEKNPEVIRANNKLDKPKTFLTRL